MNDEIRRLHEQRNNALLQARSVVQRAHEERRADLSGEEEQTYQRAEDEIRRLDELIERRQREYKADEARSQFPTLFGPTGSYGLLADPQHTRQSTLERWFRGDRTAANVENRDAFEIEARSLLGDGGASGGSLIVPTQTLNSIYGYMEASNAVRRIARVIQTTNGEDLKIPRVGAHAIATQVAAQGTALAGTDPTFATMTLGAYKYGQLVQVSTELVADSAFDIVSFVMEDTGRALGRVTATDFAVGSGSGEPNGVMTACTGSVVTGGTLITPTIENFIDLQYSVADEYRSQASYLLNDITAGTIRKWREDAGGTTGAFLWQPSNILGQPPTFLGSPVFTDSNVATHGSNARVAAYGAFAQYYIRDAGPVRWERSDDFAFNTDLVSFRAIIRTDGDLLDTSAVKCLIQRVS